MVARCFRCGLVVAFSCGFDTVCLVGCLFVGILLLDVLISFVLVLGGFGYLLCLWVGVVVWFLCLINSVALVDFVVLYCLLGYLRLCIRLVVFTGLCSSCWFGVLMVGLVNCVVWFIDLGCLVLLFVVSVCRVWCSVVYWLDVVLDCLCINSVGIALFDYLYADLIFGCALLVVGE